MDNRKQPCEIYDHRNKLIKQTGSIQEACAFCGIPEKTVGNSFYAKPPSEHIVWQKKYKKIKYKIRRVK